MANVSVIQGQQGTYFYTTQVAPKAVVILNRGTNFELDLTEDVISFNTQNSVEDIMGSFNVTLANTSDKYIDRFGHNKIKKMSCVEIFVSSTADNNIVSSLPDSSTTEQSSENNSSRAALIARSDKEPFSIDNLQTIGFDFGKEKVKDKKDLASSVGNPLTEKQSVTVGGEDLNNLIKRLYPGFDEQIDTIKQAIRERSKVFLEAEKKTLETKIKNNQDAAKTTIRENWSNETNARIGIARLKNTINEDETELAKIIYTLQNLNTDNLLPSGIVLEVPPIPFQLHRIFLGVLITVSEEVTAGGQMTITLSGHSLGWWLKASTINVHPALMDQYFNGKRVTLTAFENVYSSSNAVDIFKDLIKASTDSIMATIEYDVNHAQDAYRLMALQAQSDIKVNADGSIIGRDPNLSGKKPTEITGELSQRQIDLSKGIYYDVNRKGKFTKVDITKGNFKDAAMQDWQKLQKEYNTLDANLETEHNKLTDLQRSAKSSGGTAQTDKAIENQQKKVDDIITRQEELRKQIEKNSVYNAKKADLQKQQSQNEAEIAGLAYLGQTEILNKFGIIEAWKQIFARIVLELGNEGFLRRALPFKYNLRGPERLDGDYRTKADLAEEIARNLFFEFYCDTNGHFVLKPPFYNIGISDQNESYIVKDYHVLSFSTNDTVDGMITRITTTGNIQEFANGNMPAELTYATYQDLNLVKDYGVHAQQLQSVIFIRNVKDSIDFGEAYMNRNNMNLKNATITITGRPELRLGVALYFLPRDTVYYIKDISHQFNVKDRYTTTITGVGARKVLYGYKVKSKINEFYTKFDANNSQELTYLNKDVDKLSIENYIPVFSPSYADSIYGDVVAEGRDGTPIAANTQQVIMRNTYMIVSHPSIGLVGLIIDAYNPLLKATNLANFNTLKRFFSSPKQNIQDGKYTNVPKYSQNTYKWAVSQTKPEELDKCFKILNYMLKTVVTKTKFKISGESELKSILDDGEYEKWDLGDNIETIALGSGAAQDQKNSAIKVANYFTLDFLGNFYNFAFDFLAAGANKNCDTKTMADLFKLYGIEADTGEALTYSQKNTSDTIYANTQNLLSNLIEDTSSNGSYRRYTDKRGRELPARLDYGFSMQMRASLQQVQKTAYQNEQDKQASKDNQNRQEREDKAAALTGVKAQSKKPKPPSNQTKTPPPPPSIS